MKMITQNFEAGRKYRDKLSSNTPSRRDILKAIPALMFAPQLLAQSIAQPVSQSAAQAIPIHKIHSFGLRVTSVERSIAFYQELFGAPVQSRQGDTVFLRIGEGPHFFSIRPTIGSEESGFTHIGLSMPNFDVDTVQEKLSRHGITPASQAAADVSPLNSAMHSWINTRGTDKGGAMGGTRDLYFADREGLTFQLMGTDYCGGAGTTGNLCETVEPSPTTGVMQLVDLNHFTNYMGNSGRANEFYPNLFGLNFLAYQGPTMPTVSVGDGFQFLMFVGGNQAGIPTRPARIDHVSLSITNFNVDNILSTLTNFGLAARETPSNTPPLSHWVSLRMPNRGGVEGGTPEVYFSDPDGIHMQLQDPTYCGGGGYLGEICER